MNLPEVPPADEITAEWWEATQGHVLKVQQCSDCEHLQHPPRALCTACASMEHLRLTEASGRGEVDSYTVIHRAPRPDVEVPYTVARVRLEEGPILLTRLVGSNEWQIGDPVTVDWLDLPDDRALPVFRRAND